jgi:hypothetical protein
MKSWSATTTPPIDCCTNFWTCKLSMPWAARICLYDRIKKSLKSFATTYVFVFLMILSLVQALLSFFIAQNSDQSTAGGA